MVCVVCGKNYFSKKNYISVSAKPPAGSR